jgi:hypothetical protein
MMRLLQSFRRRKAIRAYRRRLGPALKKRYGKQATYTPGQVRKTAYGIGCPTDQLCYAYSMYCSQEDFQVHHAAIGVHCDYDSMRAEVGTLLFDGNSDFSVGDCLDTSSWSSGIDFGSHDTSGWGDGGSTDSGGGGDDGGGSGGGGD